MYLMDGIMNYLKWTMVRLVNPLYDYPDSFMQLLGYMRAYIHLPYRQKEGKFWFWSYGLIALMIQFATAMSIVIYSFCCSYLVLVFTYSIEIMLTAPACDISFFIQWQIMVSAGIVSSSHAGLGSPSFIIVPTLSSSGFRSEYKNSASVSRHTIVNLKACSISFNSWWLNKSADLHNISIN